MTALSNITPEIRNTTKLSPAKNEDVYLVRTLPLCNNYFYYFNFFYFFKNKSHSLECHSCLWDVTHASWSGHPTMLMKHHDVSKFVKTQCIMCLVTL